MLKRSLSLAAAAFVAAGFIGSAAAAATPIQQVVINASRAQAADDAAFQRYRATVLGHGNAFTPVQTVERANAGFVPGGYAQYLIRNGESESAALARAARLGDATSYRVVQTATGALSGDQLHEKMLGRSPLIAAATPLASANLQ